MKKIGIVGGVSWLSTAAYYAGICRLAERAHSATHMEGAPAIPEMAIESLDHRRAITLLGEDGDEDSWKGFDDYHADALRRLEDSRADFALIASNTAHHRFVPISKDIGIPLINLFDELAKLASSAACQNVLILGTAITMDSRPLVESFKRLGILASGPREPSARRETIQITKDLFNGDDADCLKRLEAIVARELTSTRGTRPAVCLACTELPLVFSRSEDVPTFEYGGVTYIDSTSAHIHAAFESATGQRNL